MPIKNCFSDRKLEKELVKKEWSYFAKKHLEREKKMEPSKAQPWSYVLMVSEGAGKGIRGAKGVCIGLMSSWAECSRHGSENE